VPERAVEAREDERRILDQRRELALAARELAHRAAQRRGGVVALADVAADDEPARRTAAAVAQRRQRRLDVQLAAVAADVDQLAAPRPRLAHRRLGAGVVAVAVPARAVEPLERVAERVGCGHAVLRLGGGVEVDEATGEVDGDDRILHLREDVAAQPVRRRVSGVERVDRVVDDDRVDLARADRAQRLLGLVELDPQRRELARALWGRIGGALPSSSR
jgi:hypothetical protein